MDAKDLRTEAALGDRSNDGNSKYAQGGPALPSNRNKLYHDVGPISLPKVDVQTARPCAVIGPDRVVPPSASNEAFGRKGPPEPWLGMDTTYRRPPDYPQKLVDYQHPTRNISPRQTFQENMQRIMVPPSYNSMKQKDDHNFPVDSNVSTMRSNKLNMPSEAKYCDVPYTINPMINEHKNVRTDIGVTNVNSTQPRSGPQAWPSGAGNVRPPKPYGAPELYQYPDYSSCSGQRPMLMARSHRTVHEESGPVYPDAYYHDGSIRFKPYPSMKERYPQSRYEYITNYTSPFHPPPPFPTHKYDLQKQIPPHPYPGYPQVPLKYLEARMSDQIMNGYQRTTNQQPNFNNIPFRNQVIHPTYGAVPGSCVQPNKFYPYSPDNSVKTVASNKLPYDTNNKLYADYENSRNKAYTMPEGFYMNEINRPHLMKAPVLASNYPPTNMHPHPYYRKDNPALKNYEFGTHFRNIDPSININGNPLPRFPSQFSPNAISPSDSNTSNDTNQTQGTLQEDCGYVSQSSSASVRSIDSGIHRIPYDMYRRYDYGYASLGRTSSSMSKHEPNPNNNVSKEKKNIDVRQFLQMWNEGEDENLETNSNDVNVKTITNNTNEMNNSHDGKNKELYVLGLEHVPREELGKYEHIQKVSKLPENIKGYNNIEILTKFEEVIEASYLNNFNMKPRTSRELHLPYKRSMTMQELGIPPRPLSPLDVESKISQSVIHKEVGCNFEIKPCSPKMLNAEVATPVQTVCSERIIEKVTNPLSIPSPSFHTVEERTESCNVMNSQDRLMSIKEKSKIPSCKMINTQCSSNEPVDSVKTSYTLQDFESSSGVCLASLPQLDNDIELNFPEVNQQFINANKVDSVITTTQIQDLPALDVPLDQPEFKDPKETESNQSLSKNEKELSKLTKYRKLKKNVSQCKSSISEPIAQAMRKDSVIIKNPENRPTTNFVETQHKPMNLTAYSENRIHAIDSKLDKTNKFAIDFSLNSNENYDFANNSEITKINSENHHNFTENTCFHEERPTENRKELHASLNSKFIQNENFRLNENTKCEINEKSLKNQGQIIEPSEESESRNGNEIEHIELCNLPLIPTEDSNSIINSNSDLVIEDTEKSPHIEDTTTHTFEDESKKNTKSPFDKSLDSQTINMNDNLNTFDNECSQNKCPKPKIFVSCQGQVMEHSEESESRNGNKEQIESCHLSRIPIAESSLTINRKSAVVIEHIEKSPHIEGATNHTFDDESKRSTKSPFYQSMDSQAININDNLNTFDNKDSLKVIPKPRLFISCPGQVSEPSKEPESRNRNEVHTESYKLPQIPTEESNLINNRNSALVIEHTKNSPHIEDDTKYTFYDESKRNTKSPFDRSLDSQAINIDDNCVPPNNPKPRLFISCPGQVTETSKESESWNENEVHIESCNLPQISTGESNLNINSNSALVIEHTEKKPHIEDDTKHTFHDESKRNTKSPFDRSLDSQAINIDDNYVPPNNSKPRLFISNPGHVTKTSKESESRNGNEVHIESCNLPQISTGESNLNINRNSALVIEHAEKKPHIEDDTELTYRDESKRNTKSPFDQSLDSHVTNINDNLKTFDNRDLLNECPKPTIFISRPEEYTVNQNIECNTKATVTADIQFLKENVESPQGCNKRQLDYGTEDNDRISCVPTSAQFTSTELTKEIITLPHENAQILGQVLGSNGDHSNNDVQDDSIESTNSQIINHHSRKANKNSCGNNTSKKNIRRDKKELFSPRMQNLIVYHEGLCKTKPFLNKTTSEIFDTCLGHPELINTDYYEDKFVADTKINFEKPYVDEITTIKNIEVEPTIKKTTKNTCEDQISDTTIDDNAITESDKSKLEVKSANTNGEVVVENLQYNSVDVAMQSSGTPQTEHKSCTDLTEQTIIIKCDINDDVSTIETSITEELSEDTFELNINEDIIHSKAHNDLKITKLDVVSNKITASKIKTNNYAIKYDSATTCKQISGKNEIKDPVSPTYNLIPATFSAASTLELHGQVKETSETNAKESELESNSEEYVEYTCTNKNENLNYLEAGQSKLITHENTTQNGCRNIKDKVEELTSEDMTSNLPVEQIDSQMSSCKLRVCEMSDNHTAEEIINISVNNSISAINMSEEVAHVEIHHEIKSSQELTEAREKEMDYSKSKNTKLYESFPKIPIVSCTQRRGSLKRSLSESALEDIRDISKQEVSESNFLWPNKRKKIIETENIPELIAQNYSNIIQHARRNSISSIHNDENSLYCILIDDNCIIAEDYDDTEKICYTEIPEDNLSCIPHDPPINADSDDTTEMVPFQEEINGDYSNPFASDYQEKEHTCEEPWVEDVACVETIFSDDVAEDIVISASPSTKDMDSSNDEYENETIIYDVNNHTEKVKYIYGEKMCSNDAQLVETLYRTPQMNVNKTLINKESQITEESSRYYDKESLEKVLSESNISEETTDERDGIHSKSSLFQSDFVKNDKENIDVDRFDSYSVEFKEKDLNITSDEATKKNEQVTYNNETQDDTIHSCESSIDNVFAYSKREESPNCTISSSPEVSSTTSEERNSGIFLKITNYGGSRVSQINDVNTVNNTNRISCKYTENIGYLNTKNILPPRPLLTKAAQKYIPPLKETIPDLKVKLPLPSHSLIKLKQLKVSKEKPKLNKPNVVNTRKEISKKPKPKFEDVLKSIDEIQFQMHRDKSKKIKKSIPKVVIKKSHNGSHYASTANSDKFNPDLTGRKWQPWVFLEKNNFIDKMALKRKTRAVYNHRKNNYVLIEKFKKYKSIENAKFVITQPNIDDSTSGLLKYTIRLKHTY